MARWLKQLGLLALLCAVTGAHADELHFSVTQSWTMPLGRFEQDRFVGGFLFDLMSSIAEKSGMQARFIVLPRKRVDAAVAAGEIDVRCYLNRRWVSNPDDYIWSGPVFSNEDVIVSVQARSPVDSLANFDGARIGTILGYVYPTLEDAFRSKALLREDSPDEASTLRKAKLGRIDLLVIHRLLLDWLHRENPSQVFYEIYSVQQFDTECAIAKRSKIDAAKILNAIDALRRSGAINHIVQRYR